MHNKPMTPTERIVKYTQFAAEFGPLTNLVPYGIQLGYVQYFMLDIIIPLLLIVLTILFVITKITAIVFRRICKKFAQNRIKID